MATSIIISNSVDGLFLSFHFYPPTLGLANIVNMCVKDQIRKQNRNICDKDTQKLIIEVANNTFHGILLWEFFICTHGVIRQHTLDIKASSTTQRS